MEWFTYLFKIATNLNTFEFKIFKKVFNKI